MRSDNCGNTMRRTLILILCLLLVPCAALADFTVYFLDVGQGDCAIIECDGYAMIIDGGLPGQSSKVYSFIRNDLYYKEITYVVATHPDNDHIGGLPAVFNAVKDDQKKVRNVFSPIKELDTPRFTDLKNKVEESHLKIQIPYDKEPYDLGSAKVTFYNCGREKKGIIHATTDWFKSIFNRDDPEENEDNNNMSIVVKIQYGETIFLFTGDIETEAEADLLGSGIDLKADVIKIAHHGSTSSSSIDFLSAVSPKYAVISCGKGNRYGHPEQMTLDELKQRNVELYRTDLQSTITCHSDGHHVTFETKEKTQSDLFTAPEKK